MSAVGGIQVHLDNLIFSSLTPDDEVTDQTVSLNKVLEILRNKILYIKESKPKSDTLFAVTSSGRAISAIPGKGRRTQCAGLGLY